MVKIVREHPTYQIIELLVDGKISKGEMAPLFAHMEKRTVEWGEIQLLEEVRDIGQIEFGVFWKELRFGLRNIKAIRRVAVVTDIVWVQSLTKLVEPMFKTDIRVFTLGQKEIAKTWLQQNLEFPIHVEMHP